MVLAIDRKQHEVIECLPPLCAGLSVQHAATLIGLIAAVNTIGKTPVNPHLSLHDETTFVVFTLRILLQSLL
jgi:hypothetical protein